MATCANGHENPDGNRFCSECGSPLGNASAHLPDVPSVPISLTPAAAGSEPVVREASPNGSGRRTLFAIVGAVVVVAIAIAIFFAVGHKASHTIVGTFTVSDTGDSTLGLAPSVGGSDSDCYGTGGYSDIRSGLSVTVKDGQGQILATSSLGPGSGTISGIVGVCVFKFSIVVPDTGFYSVEVGHRGSIDYSRTQLASKTWHVDLSLGG